DDAPEYIVVTESGILFEMRNKCPQKTFLAAPAEDSECQCNQCEYMKLNTLRKVYEALRDGKPEINVDPIVAEKALRPIERMLRMS
ncbi:MAG: quinolinate synthase NadA, partial [Muribaculaceae bacterium]|nr:quinolinate synthase NadA [Muribaculaceae bacterium]